MTQIILTGTGRCGTGFASRLLTSAGVPCTHEAVFNLGGWDYAAEQLALRRDNPDWGWMAESSWLAMPFLDRLEDVVIVHLVRHPKDVMDSELRVLLHAPQQARYFSFMRQHIPELDRWPKMEDVAACWYLRVNQKVEPYADFFHRIEDDPRKLLNALGIDYQGKELFGNTRYNARSGYGPSDVMLNDIAPSLRFELQLMMDRYGYTWTGDEPRWVEGVLFDDVRLKVGLIAAHMGGAWQMRDAEGRPMAYDPNLLKFFAGKVAKKPDALVVDVGASTGSFALLPTVVDCRVEAFEPNPLAARELRRNLKLNGLNGQVNVHEIALCHRNGSGSLHVPRLASWAAVACLAPGKPRRDELEWQDIPVQVATLDGYKLKPDFLKIDVEGGELLVLEGAEATISQYHPGILIEYTTLNTGQFGYERERIVDWLKAHSYTHFEQVGIEDLWASVS